MKTKLSLRKDTKDSKGRYKVMLTAHADGKRIRKMTQILVRPEHWNPRKECVFKVPDAPKLNGELEHFIKKVEDELLGYGDASTDFEEFAQTHCNNLKERTSRLYMDTVRYFLNWYTENYGLMYLNMNDLNREMLKDYRDYQYAKGLSPNAVGAYMRPLRAIYYQAQERNLIDRPFSWRLLIPSSRLSSSDDGIATSIDVFRKIYLLKPKDLRYRTYQALALTQFLLRGMDYIDVIHIKREDIRGELLYFRGREKLGDEKRVPTVVFVPKVLRELFNGIANHKGDYLFPAIDHFSVDAGYRDFGSLYSRWLKRFTEGELQGSKKIRHSFATILYSMDAPGELISKALMHSTGTSIGNRALRSLYIKQSEEEIRPYLLAMEQAITTGRKLGKL